MALTPRTRSNTNLVGFGFPEDTPDRVRRVRFQEPNMENQNQAALPPNAGANQNQAALPPNAVANQNQV